MLRTVADETPSPAAITSADEATGAPDAMYSRTCVASTRLARSFISISTRSLGLLTALYNSELRIRPGRVVAQQPRHRVEQTVDRARLLEACLAVDERSLFLVELFGEA